MFTTKPIQSRTEGLERLLDVFHVQARDWTLEEDALCLADGRRIPLLSWRTHFHNKAFLNFSCGEAIRFGPAHANGLAGPSAFRLLYAGCKSEGLNAMLRRELDLSEYLLNAKTVHVFAMHQGDVLHVSTRLDNGVVCTLELNAALPEGTHPVYKHELTTQSGFVTDRAVDAQMTPQQMYVLNADGEQGFNEWDTLTYGLSNKDAIDVRAAFALLSGAANPNEYVCASNHLDRLCDLVWQSAKRGEKLDVREVEQ